MKNGRRTGPTPSLAEIRQRAAKDLARLPEELRRLKPGASYPVGIGDGLLRLTGEVDRHHAEIERGAR